MEIIRANHMGMCFGVRQAIETAMELPSPGQTTIWGELVHNPDVARSLDRRGFQQRGESDRRDLPTTPATLVTAHGISERERRRLQDAGKRLIDTTCPLVRRIHETAQRLEREGYFVIMIGRPGHVEVRGVVEDLERHAVVSTPGEVRQYGAERLGVIAQSTASPAEAQSILDAIAAKNPGKEIQYVPTICQPTLDRQSALHDLLDRVEALVVIGGKNSNNTRQLVNTARSRGVACLHVQTAGDLAPEWFSPFHTVGLTAGTSTPDSIIESVHDRLRQFQSSEAPLSIR